MAALVAAPGCSLLRAGTGQPTGNLIGAGRLEEAPVATSAGGVVAAGSPEAAKAGAEILAAGGNAVDAAVAAAFALSATDPGDSGLGGQTFILIHLSDGRDVAVDGAAPAPLRVDRRRLQQLKERGELYGYPVVAVPTTVAALAHALERYGTMSFARVLQPAIAAAEEGYRLRFCERAFVGSYVDKLKRSPVLAPLTLAGDGPRVLGDHLVVAGLADTLRRLAAGGPMEFYRGGIARQIAADMRAHGGFVTEADLALVRIPEMAPARGRYRDRVVLSLPYPGGGAAVVEALGILDAFPPAALAPGSGKRLQLLLESVQIATHDVAGLRIARSGSPVAVTRATLEVVDPRQRARLVRFDRALEEKDFGPVRAVPVGAHNTSQLSVADAEGNVVALTQTLGRCYGACVATPGLGFPYNSLLEPYSFDDPVNPYFLRPRGVMPTWISPTVVLDRRGAAVAALGSAGSGRIVSAVVDTVVNLVDGGMSPREAVEAPRAIWGGPANPRAYVELAAPLDEADAARLQALGYDDLYRLLFPARPIDLVAFGGVNSVVRDEVTGAWVAVADPRRNGGVAASGSPQG